MTETLPPTPPREYHVTKEMLAHWGACTVRVRLVRLFPDQPGVPLTDEACATIVNKGYGPGWYLLFLLDNRERFARFQALLRAELAHEQARQALVPSPDRQARERIAEAARLAQELTNRGHLWATVPDIMAYFRGYLYRGGIIRDEVAANLVVEQWLLGLVLRVLDQELPGGPLDVYQRRH